MTATATAEEVKDVIVSLGLKEAPIVLQASPVQSHIKFSILRRPSNNFGLDGIVSSNDTRKPGLMDLLDRVYLKQYLEDLKRGQKPNKCIIFCRGNGLIGALYGRLMERTGFKYSDCIDAPFVMNHSSLLPPTEKVLAETSLSIFQVIRCCWG